MTAYRTLALATAMTLAMAACNRPQADNAAADSAPAPAADATGMPQTQSSTATATPPPGTDGTPASGDAFMASTTHGAEGAHLTDSAGHALYTLEGDTDGGKCTGDCLKAWPPVLVTGALPTAGTGLAPGAMATITRADGAIQATYAGHPLHRYAADTGAGSTSGSGVKDQWGTWALVPVSATPAAAAK